MPAKRQTCRTKAAAAPDKAKTVTCRHCRYERPAGDVRCHICGYPWPWLPRSADGRHKD